MKPTKSLSRKELYDLVWTKPMTKLADEFGLSDVGLRKKCKKHHIPMPPAGYWAKIKHNKPVSRKNLPNTDDLSLDAVEFYPHDYPANTTSPEIKQTLTQTQREKVLAFKPPERIHKYHPLLLEAREEAKSTRHPDRYGHINFGTGKTGFDVRITAGTLDRTSRFLQALINLFTQLGWEFRQVRQRYGSDNDVTFVFGGETLRFRIKERIKQTLHVKTEKELKSPYYWGPKYDYVATGLLELSITNMWRAEFKTSWKDKPSIPLEKQLLDIAKGFSLAFELSKVRSIEDEEQRKIQAIEEEKRARRARAAAIEKHRRNELLNLVTLHQTSTNIMALVAAIETKASPSEELCEWVEWAKGVANAMDPTHNATGILDRFNLVADESS